MEVPISYMNCMCVVYVLMCTHMGVHACTVPSCLHLRFFGFLDASQTLPSWLPPEQLFLPFPHSCPPMDPTA